MNEVQKVEKPWWQSGMRLFVKLSGWIGGPIVIAVFLGRYLDDRYHTAPWLFLITVGVAFLISMLALITIGFKEFKKIEDDAIKDKSERLDEKR